MTATAAPIGVAMNAKDARAADKNAVAIPRTAAPKLAKFAPVIAAAARVIAPLAKLADAVTIPHAAEINCIPAAATIIPEITAATPANVSTNSLFCPSHSAVEVKIGASACEISMIIGKSDTPIC